MRKSNILAILLMLIVCCFSKAQTKESLQIAAFKDPSKEFMPMPFWHMNGDLEDDEIVRQMKDSQKMNFSGLAILPMYNMTPEFLSESYFEKYKLILETAKKMDMNIVMYDDVGFPSGTAGGKIERDFPQYVRKSLEKIEIQIKQRPYFKSFIPAGHLMAVVAMEMNSKKRIDLAPFIENKLLTWNVPKGGDWTVQFYMCTPATFWKSYMPVDAMNPEAVNQFIDLTYNEYAKRFSSYFKYTIQLTFFDDVGFLRKERTWTGKFNEKFEEVNGFSPTVYYPALWYDIGEETEAARVAFFNTRSELLAEGYPKQVKGWTEKYGLKNTGHPPGNYGIQPVDMHGDIFKFFRYTDLPLTDAIIDYGHGRDGFKLISSAADYYDRPIVSTEVFGAFKEAIVDKNMLYRTTMELFVRGVNFTVPHGMWYNPKKIGIPPLISAESKKLAPVLPDFSNYVGRSCYMLQGGKRVSEIAILYPIESLQAGYYFDASENTKRAGAWAYPEADYQEIGSMLTNEIRQDFTFVHPEFLIADKYTIQDETLQLNNETNHQAYKVMIIPGGKVISVKALQKIKKFYDEGGQVIATTLLPSKSSERGKDAEIIKLVQELFGTVAVTIPQIQTNKKGGKSVFIANPSKANLAKILADLHPNPTVYFDANPIITSDLGLFSYMQKVKDGKNIYYFANSSDQKINTTVYLKEIESVQIWNPNNGSISSLEKLGSIKRKGENYTRFNLKLEPVSSVFYVEK
ncbi:glycosyl hydrolase [Formosa sp. PL04]|uniref:glycosyl hydrolase n=1 Tax=Formosa sp. PL04 TaxID=3081755 RepID=UPI0029820757|nr:glycosyl hydrolase [Formosa sp. PL04]MDW5288109.1 glycosyl hydrolase [Formosa sp. PL04]